MRHCGIRLFVIGLAAALSGCSSIDLLLADPVFEPKPPTAMATPPAFRVGDVFRYRIGDSLIAESVEKIDAEGVWWQDSLGRRWIGGEGALIPGRKVAEMNVKPQIAKAVMESTGDLFPLTIGKTVAYRSTVPNGFQDVTTHKRSCTVDDFGTLKTAVGAFDTYRLKCQYDGTVRFNYYAPTLGRIVLQTSDTIFDSVRRELVAFGQGIDKTMRPASGSSEFAAPKMQKKSPAARAGATRFGVQLAAYRSQSRIKKAWGWIKRRGGPLLADASPNIERHEGNGGPLFRLIVGNFATKNEARTHCRALKRGGVDCWPRPRTGKSTVSPVAAADPQGKLNVVRR